MPRRKEPEPPRLTDAEWDVMNAVWDGEPVTAQDVVQALDERRAWSPRTIKTMLARLVGKAALEYEVEGKRYLYRSAFPRSACQKAEGQRFLDRVLGGAPHPLLAFFVREGRLSDAERNELRRLIDEQERKEQA